ncbi:MAG TPA: hypothetical protein DCE56_32680 [Cyanobacteria bacterium UBA8553]|nr:hypothetical protein [Cyanobacteria bacterium UBA8553]HAJ58170.1 hypothetical protein [Cyanobacteria bacterium UBA8543]
MDALSKDDDVLAFAVSHDRAVITINRFNFVRLHRLQPDHSGIIVCSDDPDRNQMAVRINEAISAKEILRGKLIRVNRPSK